MLQMHLFIKSIFYPILLLVLSGCAQEEYLVSSKSMSPTLVPGDLLMVSEENNSIKRLDIVLFRVHEPDAVLVLRVVGLPGDRIHFRDDAIFVNGSPINLLDFGINYIYMRRPLQQYATETEYIVPYGTFFLIGDNLLNAKDSRFFGAVPIEDIIGIAKKVGFRSEDRS